MVFLPLAQEISRLVGEQGMPPAAGALPQTPPKNLLKKVLWDLQNFLGAFGKGVLRMGGADCFVWAWREASRLVHPPPARSGVSMGFLRLSV